MRVIQLKILAEGTKFEYQSKMYEKGGFCKGEDVMCHPILGGKVQTAIKDWLPGSTEVTVE